MIASLPMYDWPEVREATDRWWAAIATHLGLAATLQRGGDHTALWRRPDLAFSQTCGYPFTHEFRGKLKLVAAPHYGVDGCDGANYRSMVFARESKPLAAWRGGIAAVNNPDSMSGMLALKLVFGPLARDGQFFAGAIATGGHIDSLIAVRDGKADVCATDAVCVALARTYRPECLEGLVEIARSPMVPSLPYVTVSGGVALLRGALAAAFADPDLRQTRDQLFLTGYSALEPRAYDRITELETGMRRAGGLKLL
jgi:ABC-type phosphate/phosphonate transport system substrate-binding protein